MKATGLLVEASLVVMMRYPVGIFYAMPCYAVI